MVQRSWWQRPQIRTDEEEDQERKASWLELFFDLIFVAVIAELAHDLSNHISLAGVGKFILLFIPVYWVWIGATYYNERFETEGLENRIFTFVQMLPVAGLAVFAHYGLSKTSVAFALCYASARLLTTVLWFLAGIHEPSFRPTARWFVTGFSIAISLFVISVFVPPPGRFILWIIGLLIDVLTPIFTIEHQASLPKFSTSKLPERYGLFMIIVLGESVFGTVHGLAEQETLTFLTGLTGVLGMSLAFGMWAIYFDFIARRYPRQNMVSSFAWAYLHLPLVISITATGAGILRAIAFGGETLPDEVRILIVSALSLALALVGIIETTLHRHEHEPTHPRFSPALKLGGAAFAMAVGLSSLITSPILLLIMLLCVIAVQIAYGLVVWFA